MEKSFFFTLGISLSCIVLSACSASPNSATKTSDGNESIVHSKNFKSANELSKSVVAILSHRQDGQALCTGSILSENMILTAAHCVDGEPAQIELIFANDIKTATATQKRRVSCFAQNPFWRHPNTSRQGDLALLYFSGGLPSGYIPTELAPRTEKVIEGATVYFLGYGVTSGKKRIGSGVLRSTSTTVVGEQSPTEVITDGQKTSVCFGDSGGPAFIENNGHWFQWGVASSVLNQDCNEASIHTAVMLYETWIRNTSAKLISMGSK